MSTAALDPQQYFENRQAIVQKWREEKKVYPQNFRTTISMSDFLSKYADIPDGERLEQESLRVAGRISRVASSSSKLRFFDLKSDGFKIQVFADLTNHSYSSEEFNEKYNSIKRGDIVGIIGFPGRSKRGELSIFPREISILSPCLYMLPDKYGFKDFEARFRQRYLDFMVNDESFRTMKLRSQITNFLRVFLTERGFIEVETSMMNQTCGGASAKPFITHHNALDADLFLRIAPELQLKMIIIGGFEKVFEIGRNFRNEGIDTTHYPEFTTCEFYWAYADYEDLMVWTETFLSSLALNIHGKYQIPYHPCGPDGPEVILDFEPPYRKISLIDELEDKIGFKLSVPYDSEENCKKYVEAIRASGLELPNPPTPAKLIDKLVGHFIEDSIGGRPAFIIDHPRCMSPLSKLHRSRENSCERFELFLCGKELINAYSESDDPAVQRQNLKYQLQERESGDEESFPADEDFCVAMEYGLPPTAGLGLGIDRLVMFMADKNNIKEVLFFPNMKPTVAATSTTGGQG